MALNQLVPDNSTSEAIKGKTYMMWSSGKFDNHPDAASAGRITFNSTGLGKARSFTGYDPT